MTDTARYTEAQNQAQREFDWKLKAYAGAIEARMKAEAIEYAARSEVFRVADLLMGEGTDPA